MTEQTQRGPAAHGDHQDELLYTDEVGKAKVCPSYRAREAANGWAADMGWALPYPGHPPLEAAK